MEERQTLLIVEDEIVNRKILKKILEGEYDIVEAENGLRAWELLSEQQNQISAVLLDIIMPVMDGYGFLEKLKKASMTELPVIVMTGESDVEAEQRALDAGAWDFVTKPYHPQILKSRLRNAMARRQVAVFRKMQKMAAHDPLTGLHNRTRMFQQTRKMIDSNPDTTFLFLRADIDHFALYNSAFGEEEGDRLLCYLGKQFSDIAKAFPVCAYGRINSDIFCCCIPYTGNLKLLEEVVETTQKKLAEYRKDYLLEISVGAYVIKEPALSVEEFYMRATMGAAACKRQYGVHIGFYDERDGMRAAREIEITNEMEHALDAKQFVIYFQPKVRLSTDRANGAEALIRWNHPEKGLISPGLFIPVFERNGFIAKLDYYVWDNTCRILRGWVEQGLNPDPVSVNISRISLYNPQLVEDLTGLLQKHQLDVKLLQLEITESAYMTNQDLMKDTIHKLKTAGFTILMDDFGSGYSSLNTLKEIEVDILKIDMKFLPRDSMVEKAEIILASMIKMANWLGMSVVVEGVETRSQRDFLEGTGCEYVQGYYYARPMPEADYERDYVKAKAERERNQGVAEELDETKAQLEQHANTILVIDDMEMDRSILADYFKDKYHVKLCASAEEGLVYLKRYASTVSLILMDNMMPGMSGIDFLIYCQDNPQLKEIPKIMITAGESVNAQVKAFQCGAYDYITKPLIREVVEARVRHVMEVSGKK